VAKVKLSKGALKQQRDQLQMYERFLPSLDLKRQQLMGEYKKALQTVTEAEQRDVQAGAGLTGVLSLLGTSDMDLSGLVTIASIQVEEENLLGVRVPALREVACTVVEYSFLAKPFWVDDLAERLKEKATARIELQVYRERAARLHQAVRRITQRVNLFGKVLIPEARQNIQKIRLYLADAERAAVVNSKIAKRKP
jgi:V/A-type H+-transporting ATPase subunit D